MKECQICYRKKRRFSLCACSFEACEACVTAYLLTCENAKCMNCHREWTILFIESSLSKISFRIWKKHMTEILFKLDEENLKISKIIVEIENTIYYYRIEIIRNKKIAEKSYLQQLIQNLTLKKQVILEFGLQSCAKCEGVLDNNYCIRCNLFTCDKCMLVDTRFNHVCDVNVLNNLEKIFEYSKACPVCKMRIFKNGGCNDMYCVHCKSFFDWETLKIFKTKRHNPHYTGRVNNIYECSSLHILENKEATISIIVHSFSNPYDQEKICAQLYEAYNIDLNKFILEPDPLNFKRKMFIRGKLSLNSYKNLLFTMLKKKQLFDELYAILETYRVLNFEWFTQLALSSRGKLDTRTQEKKLREMQKFNEIFQESEIHELELYALNL